MQCCIRLLAHKVPCVRCGSLGRAECSRLEMATDSVPTELPKTCTRDSTAIFDLAVKQALLGNTIHFPSLHDLNEVCSV